MYHYKSLQCLETWKFWRFLKHLERLFWVGRLSGIGCNCLSMPVAPSHLRCQALLLHHLFQFVEHETSSRSFQVSASKKLTKLAVSAASKSAVLLLPKWMIQGQDLQHLQERKRLIQVTGVWCWPAGPGHPCQLSAWASRGICMWMYKTSKLGNDKSWHGKANSAKTPVPWLAAQ